MLATLTVRDESMFNLGSADFENSAFTLSFQNSVISVRELIETRVRREVEDYNRQQPATFRGLVQPSAAERTLNGFKLPKQQRIDGDEQTAKAIAAFERNGFIVLVDDRQVDCLDSLIEVKPRTTVTFLKLVPLVGG